jgi:hypothetical protein
MKQLPRIAADLALVRRPSQLRGVVGIGVPHHAPDYLTLGVS